MNYIEKQTLTFSLELETRNNIRYSEDTDRGARQDSPATLGLLQ